MRIHFASKNHCANVAKSLKKHLSSGHADLKLSDCQNAVGRMMGYRNWHELEASCSAAVDPSAYDDEIGALERAGRRVQFAAALATVLGFDIKTGFDVVDRIAPMASKAPTGTVGSDVEGRDVVVFSLFQGDWGNGVALTRTDEMSDRRTFLIAAYKGGRFGLFEAAGRERSPESYAALVGSGDAKGSWHFDLVLALLGYRAATDWTAVDEDGKFVNSAGSKLATARAHLEANLDREIFRAWAAAPGMTMTSLPYDLARESGPHGTRRMAFAREYGTYLNFVTGQRDTRQEDVDGSETPAEAMAEFLGRKTDLKRDEALLVLRRLGALRFGGEFEEYMCLGYEVLSGLEDGDMPTSQAELDAFAENLWVMAHCIRDRVLDRVLHLRRVLSTAKDGGTWAACLEKIESTAALGAARLRGCGIELDAEDAHPKDHVCRFFDNLDDCMSQFAWDTVEPALGLTDPRVAAVHSHKELNWGDSGALIPPAAFENACTKLFLEDIGFGALAELCFEWHLQDARQGYRSKSTISPLLREAVEARLDGWRPFLRPAYRRIDLEGLLAASNEGMAAQGAGINRRARSRRAA